MFSLLEVFGWALCSFSGRWGYVYAFFITSWLWLVGRYVVRCHYFSLFPVNFTIYIYHLMRHTKVLDNADLLYNCQCRLSPRKKKAFTQTITMQSCTSIPLEWDVAQASSLKFICWLRSDWFWRRCAKKTKIEHSCSLSTKRTNSFTFYKKKTPKLNLPVTSFDLVLLCINYTYAMHALILFTNKRKRNINKERKNVNVRTDPNKTIAKMHSVQTKELHEYLEPEKYSFLTVLTTSSPEGPCELATSNTKGTSTKWREKAKTISFFWAIFSLLRIWNWLTVWLCILVWFVKC